MKDKLTEEFLQAIKEIENSLLILGFKPDSFIEKGLANFIKFKTDDSCVEFLFGPSDWDIEMIIFISNNKFAFKDLLQISVINDWVNKNRYKQKNKRNLKDELLWYVDLLKFSLPIIVKQ